MKKNSHKKAGIIAAALFAVCFAAGLLAQPEAAAEGISEGLMLCARVIVPSLFPFIALSAFIVKTGVSDRLGRSLAPLTRLLFHMPGAASCAIIMGAVGGYPVGGKIIAGLYREGKISRSEAQRLLLYCVNPGPAFAVSAVGVSVLGSRRAGLILFASLALSSAVIGIFSGIIHRKDEISCAAKNKIEGKSLAGAYVEAVADASAGIYGICAWIVIFSAIISLLRTLPAPPQMHNLIACVLECSRGVSSLSSRSLPLFAAILAWGGVCVHCQILPDVLKTEMKPACFILSRALHSVAAFAAARFLLFLFPQPVSVFSAAVEPLPKFTAVSLPAAIGLFIMSGLLILDVDRSRKIC